MTMRLVPFAVPLLAIACAAEAKDDTATGDPNALTSTSGSANNAIDQKLCTTHGAPANCDVCAVMGWYSDGVCDAFCGHDPECEAPATLASKQGHPSRILVDGTRLVWTDRDGGNVASVPVAGGPVTTLASQQVHPGSIAADASALYWVVDTGIMKLPRQGGAPSTLMQGASHPQELALDAKFVYLTDDHRVTKTALDGSGSSTVWRDTNQDDFARGIPTSIAVDAHTVFFAVSGDGIDSEPVPGPGDPLHATPIAGGSEPRGLAIDDANVYWIEAVTPAVHGVVMKSPKSGGNKAVPLAANLTDGPHAIAADATNVYWASGFPTSDGLNGGKNPASGGGIWKVPKDGSIPPIRLATSSGFPAALVVDATSVYWVDSETGNVMKHSK
jgi:hypothetical protein